MAFYKTIWFWLMLLGLILVIVSIIGYIANRKKGIPKWVWVILGISIFLILSGFIALFVSMNNSSKQITYLNTSQEVSKTTDNSVDTSNNNVVPKSNITFFAPRRDELPSTNNFSPSMSINQGDNLSPLPRTTNNTLFNSAMNNRSFSPTFSGSFVDDRYNIGY